MDVSQALQPFVWGAGGSKKTPEQLERERKMADALRVKEAPTGPWSLIGALAREGVAGYRDHRADAEEKKSREAADALFQGLSDGYDQTELMGLIGNEFASKPQQAVAQALLQRNMQENDPAYQLDLEYKQAQLDSLNNPAPSERPYDTDANGVKRYLDTGEPVFPEMEGYEPPKEFGGDQFDTETKLRTEYQGQQGYKDFSSQERAYQRVLDSASNPSPAGDLALIFNYMKILDPGSVVRESEFATAAQSGSYGDQIQAAVNRVVSGERLSDGMRKDFVNRAGQLFKGAADIHSGMNQRYSGLAEQYGIEPDKIIREAERIGVLDPAFDVDQLLQIVTDQPVQLKPETADQEYDALPSGAEFIAPDGTRRRKP